MTEPPSVWSEGGSRLLDYGHAGDPVILFVPSLINRAYVLDLMPGGSMVRFVATQGFRPLLLDWGWPGAAECALDLSAYIAGRLARAIGAAAALAGPRGLILAGYCMGGTMTVAAAQLLPAPVRALALLAAPWDFHAADPGGAALAQQAATFAEPVMALLGTMPVDMLQMLFATLDPGGVARKYRAFASLDQDSERARWFVALEDWLNDGVPLAAPVARDCMIGWYGRNDPGRGGWRVGGALVDPTALRVPAFVAAPARDRIVPPQSAKPLARLIPGAVLHEPGSGHIGMAAGSGAEAVLWRPLIEWLRGL